MNFTDIEQSLPNGFHDAFLEGFQIDYIQRTAVLTIRVCVSDPDSESQTGRAQYKKVSLILNKFLYFVIEPPDSRYPFSASKAVWIDSGPMESLPEPPSVRLPEPINEPYSAHWFYVSDWNSFIYFAASDAELCWI